MGLDFYADIPDGRGGYPRPHWTYSGFHRFRVAIAATIGIDLDQMEGFRVSYVPDVMGEQRWDGCEDPLRLLLQHSDCDGELAPRECAMLAPALREAIDQVWPPGIELGWHAESDRGNGLMLAELMEFCSHHRVALGFC